MKKYNRRNRKLFHSLEERPDDEDAGRAAYIVRVRAKQRSDEQIGGTRPDSIKWLQANLFEQQKASADVRPAVRPTPSANELPGGSVKNEQKAQPKVLRNADDVSRRSGGGGNSRLNKFQFHRVATPKLIGAGSHGMMRKQILPFVAITDRRLTSSVASAAEASMALQQPDAREMQQQH